MSCEKRDSVGLVVVEDCTVIKVPCLIGNVAIGLDVSELTVVKEKLSKCAHVVPPDEDIFAPASGFSIVKQPATPQPDLMVVGTSPGSGQLASPVNQDVAEVNGQPRL